MAGFPMSSVDEKWINVCIDHTRNGDISGRIFYCYAETPILFSNVGKFMRSMEKILNHHEFPMAAVQIRSFARTRATAKQKAAIGTEAKKMDVEQVTAQKGAKGTFLVKIQCRQNATWQGNVMWGEKNRTQSFRSALELIKLIDSALDVSEPDCAEKNED